MRKAPRPPKSIKLNPEASPDTLVDALFGECHSKKPHEKCLKCRRRDALRPLIAEFQRQIQTLRQSSNQMLHDTSYDTLVKMAGRASEAHDCEVTVTITRKPDA